MAQSYEVMYASEGYGDLSSAASNALVDMLVEYERITAEDSVSPHPIIDRQGGDLIGIGVALKPGVEFSGPEAIIAVAKVGEIPDRKTCELFMLKATRRAYLQRARGNQIDVERMERLSWLKDGELYKAASASYNGLHVGFAGGWPHHSRRLVVAFAKSLSQSLGLAEAYASQNPELFDPESAASRLEWLNRGHNAGDTDLVEEHQAYRYILSLVDEQV